MAIGVYSDRQLKKLIESKVICSENEIKDKQIQPSSLDLRIGSIVYCMPFSAVSFGGNFQSFLEENKKYCFNISENGSFLHKGITFVAKIQERFFLPPHIKGKVNPKSSIGRTDIHVRAITNDGRVFDKIPAGYEGDLWLEICSRSFDVRLREGDLLSQLRLIDTHSCSVGRDELIGLHKDSGLLRIMEGNDYVLMKPKKFQNFVSDDKVYMTLMLDAENPGYVARKNAPTLDLSRKDNPYSEFFEPIKLRKRKEFVIDKDSFYILSSKEAVRVPLDFCVEMSDIETSSGEFRSHYAGFFDPGWDAQATLELRNFGQPFLLRENQGIASLKYFRLKNLSNVSYGDKKVGSHYHKQRGPRLAKFFDMKK